MHTTPLLLAGLGLGGLGLARIGSPAASVRCPDVPCGTAVILVRAHPASMLPALVARAPDFAVADLVFIKLADLGPALNTFGDAGFIPRLARTWRFDDPLTLTFRLDPRARWHDGQRVTAADVAFTFEVNRDTLVNAPARPLLNDIVSVTVRNDTTVTFRFRRVYSEQFYDATHHMRIMPKHLMDSIPRARLVQHPLGSAPVGSGPYRLVSWRRGESLELVADSAFFLGPPGFARVIFRLFSDLNTAMSQLMANEADLLEYLGTPENADRIKTVEHLRLFEYPATAHIFLDFNLWNPDDLTQPHPLFANRDLRRALFQSIDRRLVVERAYGRYGSVPVGPISKAVAVGRDSTIEPLKYDTAAARRTLTQLGWRDSDGDGVLDRGGQRLEFEVILPATSVPRQRAFVVVQEQLRLMGVSVKQVNVDFPVMSQRTETRRFHASLMNWIDDPSPSAIRQTFTTDAIGGGNYRGYSNPEFDRLVDQAIAEPNATRTRALWRQAFALVNQDAPGVWLAAPIQFGAVHRRFQNVTLRPDQWTATLSSWRVAPGQTLPRDLVAPVTGR